MNELLGEALVLPSNLFSGLLTTDILWL